MTLHEIIQREAGRLAWKGGGFIEAQRALELVAREAAKHALFCAGLDVYRRDGGTEEAVMAALFDAPKDGGK